MGGFFAEDFEAAFFFIVVFGSEGVVLWVDVSMKFSISELGMLCSCRFVIRDGCMSRSGREEWKGKRTLCFSKRPHF